MHTQKRYSSDRIISANDRKQAKNYLQSAVELARIPNAEIRVINKGEENELIGKIDPSLIISSFTVETTIDNMRSPSEQIGLPFLFTMRSGKENTLA